jgi:hypothetical protein
MLKTLYYELTLSKYSINSIKFVVLEVSVIRKWAFMSSAWNYLFTPMSISKGGLMKAETGQVFCRYLYYMTHVAVL